MIVIDPSAIAEALHDLHERTLVNLVTGSLKIPEIITAIEQKGISNAQLAHQLGEERSTICKWKHQDRKPGSFDTVCRLLMIYHKVVTTAH